MQLYGAFESENKPRIDGIENQGDTVTRVHISNKRHFGLIVKDPNGDFRFANPSRLMKFTPKGTYTDRMHPKLAIILDVVTPSRDFIQEMIGSENYRNKKMESVRSINKTKKQDQDGENINLSGLTDIPQSRSNFSSDRPNRSSNKKQNNPIRSFRPS